jgi:hypothetical protein
MNPEADSDRAAPLTEAGWQRVWLGITGLLLAIHALLAWQLRAPAISTGHDDATYLLLARCQVSPEGDQRFSFDRGPTQPSLAASTMR